MDTPGQRTDEGFTLVEAVIAIVVLAVGMGACALTFNMAMRSVSTNRSKMSAVHLARNEMEVLRTQGWDDPALTIGSHVITNDLYSGQYVVAGVNDDVRNVTLSIDWAHFMTNGNAAATLTTSLAKQLR